MDLLQSWLVVGVPGLIVVAGLFVGHSRLRAALGYGALLLLVAHFVATPGGGLSAAAIGMVAVGAVATGRGTRLDARRHEHHQTRRRYTTADGSG